jgi:hypothetical protein
MRLRSSVADFQGHFKDNKQAFNTRVLQATLQLIQQMRAEANKSARDFEASWRYLRALMTQLPEQLPADHITIKLNEEFMAKLGHLKAALKLVSYLGFVEKDGVLAVRSTGLSEVQRKWRQCAECLQGK